MSAEVDLTTTRRDPAAYAQQPRQCRCERPLLRRDEDDGELVCARCGRRLPGGTP